MDKFAAEVTPYNSNPVTALFDVRGFRNAIAPHENTHGWFAAIEARKKRIEQEERDRAEFLRRKERERVESLRQEREREVQLKAAEEERLRRQVEIDSAAQFAITRLTRVRDAIESKKTGQDSMSLKAIRKEVSRRMLLISPQPITPAWAEDISSKIVVALEAEVNLKGKVERTTVLLSAGDPELDQLAADHLMRWLYEPTVRTPSRGGLERIKVVVEFIAEE